MKILFLDAYFEPEQIAFTHLESDLLEKLTDENMLEKHGAGKNTFYIRKEN